MNWRTKGAICFFGSASLWAQSLTGVIDIHVHSDPDSTARSIDAMDVAKLAKLARHARNGAEESL